MTILEAFMELAGAVARTRRARQRGESRQVVLTRKEFISAFGLPATPDEYFILIPREQQNVAAAFGDFSNDPLVAGCYVIGAQACPEIEMLYRGQFEEAG